MLQTNMPLQTASATVRVWPGEKLLSFLAMALVLALAP